MNAIEAIIGSPAIVAAIGALAGVVGGYFTARTNAAPTLQNALADATAKLIGNYTAALERANSERKNLIDQVDKLEALVHTLSAQIDQLEHTVRSQTEEIDDLNEHVESLTAELIAHGVKAPPRKKRAKPEAAQ